MVFVHPQVNISRYGYDFVLEYTASNWPFFVNMAHACIYSTDADRVSCLNMG